MAAHSETQSTVFNTDLSWKLEIDEFSDAIIKKRKIKFGTTNDAMKLMTLIEKIYSDAKVK